jgi:flagellar protein FlgJ
VLKHQEAAKAAEAATGIPANNILGQAALESGWGKHEIKMKDGSSSHNLFGIKATSNWTGKVAEVTTTEYIGGVARKVTAKFRAYDSYEEAFKDHAKLLSQSPRYSATVAKADTAHEYARGLQKAGYATDPAYADKLTRVINTTLRLQRTAT